MPRFGAGRGIPGGGTITKRQRDDKKYILLFLNYSYATIGVSKVSFIFYKLSFILRRLQALLQTLCLIPE